MSNQWEAAGSHVIDADEDRVRRIANGGPGSIYVSGSRDDREKGRELKAGESVVVDRTVFVYGDGQRVVTEDAANRPVQAEARIEDKPADFTPKEEKSSSAKRSK